VAAPGLGQDLVVGGAEIGLVGVCGPVAIWKDRSLIVPGAGSVFEDPHALRQFDRVVEGEQRWQALGATD